MFKKTLAVFLSAAMICGVTGIAYAEEETWDTDFYDTDFESFQEEDTQSLQPAFSSPDPDNPGETNITYDGYYNAKNAVQIALNQDITVNVQSAASGYFTLFFKFVLPSDGYVTISDMFSLSKLEEDGTRSGIYHIKGHSLGLAAGTYILNSSYEYNKTSVFRIDYSASSEWETEPNGNQEQATKIQPGVLKHGCADDTDWYCFTLPEAGYVSVMMSYLYDFNDQNRCWNLELYDSNNTKITWNSGYSEESSDTNTGFAIDKIGLPAGDYYINAELTESEEESDRYYALSLDYVPTPYCETEFNNNFNEADSIPLNQEIYAKFDSHEENEADYFTFTLPQDGTIRTQVTPEAEGNFSFRVLDSAKEPIQTLSVNAKAGEIGSSYTLGLAAGTYTMVADGQRDVPYTFTLCYEETDAWEKELNDTSDQANRILPDIVMHGWSEGDVSFFSNGQPDWYWFELPEDGYVTTELSYSKGIDGQYRNFSMTLYDSELNTITWNEGDTQSNSSAETGFCLEKIGIPAGKYYLRVGSYIVADVADKYYDLSLSYTATPYCETEFNNIISEADPAALNQQILAKYDSHEDGEADYFKFTLPKAGTVAVSVKPEEEGTFGFTIKSQNDEDIQQLELFGKAGETCSSHKVGLAAGTYLLIAEGQRDVPYWFTIQYEETEFWEKELNNSPDQATEFLPNTKMYGWLEARDLYYTQEDWYQLNLQTDGYVQATLNWDYAPGTENQCWSLYVYDEHQSIIARGSGYSVPEESENFIVIDKLGLAAGNYYVCVEGYDISGNEGLYYTLNISHTSTPYFEKEPNNGFEYANRITTDQETGGNFMNLDEKTDYYCFDIPKDGAITLSVASEVTQYFFYTIYDINENEITGNSYTGNGEAIAFTSRPITLKEGTYFLVLGGTSPGAYSFTVNYKDVHLHSMTFVPGQAATCLAAGIKDYYKCSECGKMFEDYYGEHELQPEDIVIEKKTSHTPGTPVQEKLVEATCTEEGSYEEVYYCIDCPMEISREKKTIPAKGHQKEVIPAVPATCTKTGLTEGTKCSVCGEILIPQEVVPALGHDYQPAVTKATTKNDGWVDSKCTRCGDVEKTTTIYKASKISLSKPSYTYNGKVQKPSAVVKDSKGNTIAKSNYTVTYSNQNSKNAGSYTVTVKLKGNYSGSKTLTYTINKAKNPLAIKVASKTYKQSKLTKAATFSIGVSKAQGKVTYTLDSKAKAAKIKVSSGKVTVPKKCKKGTYKITVKAAGKGNYKAGTKTVTIKVS